MLRGGESRIVDTLTCYEESAEDYDQWEEFKIVTQAEEKVLLSLVEDLEETDVLDIGCGTGRYAKRLEDLGVRVVGMDVSRKMIQVAKAKTRKSSYVVADGSHLPLRDGAFHLVLSALVINHIKDLVPFLTETLRTCRAAGEVIISSVWREGFQKVTEFPEYFGKDFEFTVQEYLYPPNVLHEELSKLGAKITHSIISLYIDYGEGRKGVHVLKAKKA